MTKHAPGSWGRFYHPGGKTAYHVGNSLRGVRDAVRKHFTRIDLDFNCDESGNFWNIHWNTYRKDGFKPSRGAVIRQTLISELSPEQIKTFVAPGGYIVNPAEKIIPYALKMGLTVEFEAKGTKGFEDVENWQRLAAQVGTRRIVVKTLADIPGWRKRLKAAHAAGYKTMVLNHSDKPLHISKADSQYVTYCRGKFRLVA